MYRALVVLALAASGCASATSPAKTAREFAALLHAESYDAAWALLSEESRSRLDRRELERRMRENPEERATIIAQLKGEVSEQRAVARYRLADGREVRLILEGEEWRLDGSILDVYSQKTPRLAIASFVRALENGRFDVALRFVPNAYRTPELTEESLRVTFEEELADETARILELLRDAADAPIEENGDRARIALGPSEAVLLVREDGAWKIDDLY